MCCFSLQRNTGVWYLHSGIATIKKKKKKGIPESEIFNVHLFVIFVKVISQTVNLGFSCLQYPQD